MADEKPRKVVGKPFPKGKSGNTKGRPPIKKEFRQRLLDGEGTALDTLEQAMTAKKAPWASRVRASELWLAYSRGKPKQVFELSGPDGGPLEAQAHVLQLILTDEATRDLLDAAAARTALLAGQPGGLRGEAQRSALAPGEAPQPAVAVAGPGGDDPGPGAPPAGGVDAAAPRKE